MIDKRQEAAAYDVVDEEGKPVPVGRSIFDRLPDRPAPEWQPPSDEEHATMQTAIGHVYEDWSAGVAENAPEMHALTEYGDRGEYPPFSYLFDADPEQTDKLREGVMNAVRPDAGGA